MTEFWSTTPLKPVCWIDSFHVGEDTFVYILHGFFEGDKEGRFEGSEIVHLLGVGSTSKQAQGHMRLVDFTLRESKVLGDKYLMLNCPVL